MQMLKIIMDRVTSWHAPGILFLGDAAHTMAPSGGQGLNVAIRDTLMDANHLIPALKAGAPLDASVFQKIQDEWQVEIGEIQARQTRIGQIVLKPIGLLRLMFALMRLAMMLMGKRLRAGDTIVSPPPRFLTPAARLGDNERWQQ